MIEKKKKQKTTKSSPVKQKEFEKGRLLQKMTHQEWQTFSPDASTPPTCAHETTSSISHYILLSLNTASEFFSTLGNYHWFRQGSSVTCYKTQLGPPWANKEEFHTNTLVQGCPQKVKHKNAGTRSQAPDTKKPWGHCPLSKHVSACLFHLFSLVRLSLHLRSSWGHVATHSTHVSFFQLQSPTENCIWISASNSWGSRSEWLCFGQVTSPGPISHNQKGSTSMQNSCLVPTSV